MDISPKYQMKLIQQLNDKLFEEYSGYKNVAFYIEKWHIVEYNQFDDDYANFNIYRKDTGDIDTLKTLHSVPSDILIKMAIDLGIETPDFIPAIPTFRNKLKEEYTNAQAAFEKAFKEIEEHPDVAIGMANSALESIIKQILRDEKLKVQLKGTETLNKLTEIILKQFSLFPNGDMPNELKTIGSSMMAINQQIEKLRSEKTKFHGTEHEDIVITDPMYAYFIVNSVATVGLFLDSFYNHKYKHSQLDQIDQDELPF